MPQPVALLEYGGTELARNNLSVRGDLQYTERPTITSQTKKPVNAQVALKYRGSWFYIDDSDLNTKYSFLLLDQLAALLGGKVEKAGPLLTLPVSSP